MTDPAPPAWVSKRDGRLEPFDADRISRAIFAAAEELGQHDAFLARELADAAVHFLAVECDGQTPTTAQVAESVVKYLRELGQQPLAAAFAAHRDAPRLGEVQAAARRQQTLAGIYTRDLTAAQESGLLLLTDLDAPDALAACVAQPGAPAPVARCVVVDGLEHVVSGEALLPTLAGAVIDLNIAEPPSWADALVEGPLFHDPSPDSATLAARADAVLTAWLALRLPGRIDWHLGERDFAPDQRDRLERVAELSRSSPICFVFDRPRRSIALAEGLDRRHPAALLAVELHLPALARQGGNLADVGRFVEKLGTLARLALSAAVQKRDHLRNIPGLARGFLLGRARLVVVPVGLDEVVRLFTNWGLANGGASLELGRRIVARLRDVLREDGRRVLLDVCLDGPAHFPHADRAQVPGLTPWDPIASNISQLRAAGALHALAEHGTLTLHPDGTEPLADCLREAWRRTEVVRLAVAGEPAASRVHPL